MHECDHFHSETTPDNNIPYRQYTYSVHRTNNDRCLKHHRRRGLLALHRRSTLPYIHSSAFHLRSTQTERHQPDPDQRLLLPVRYQFRHAVLQYALRPHPLLPHLGARERRCFGAVALVGVVCQLYAFPGLWRGDCCGCGAVGLDE